LVTGGALDLGNLPPHFVAAVQQGDQQIGRSAMFFQGD
jgi:hypothetical protein